MNDLAGPPSASPALQDDAAFEAAARPWARYQEIVENALAATGARITVLSRFDAASGAVRTVAWAGLRSARAQQALAAAQRLFPNWDPTRITTSAHANPHQRTVYLEGRSVSAPFTEIGAGTVDPRFLQLGSTMVGLRYACLCPLIVGHQVEGALCFFTAAPLSEAQRRTCEAFARQVALTLENGRLLETLRVQVERLRESEGRYRSLVETSPDGIVLVDLDTSILMCNQQALALLGYESQDEVRGRKALDFIAPEEHHRVEGHLRETLERGAIRNLEYVLLKRDGTRWWAELSGSPIRDAAGQPRAVMALLRDVTERKRLAGQLREAQKAEGRLEGIILAAREVGHLLNNDLGVPISVLEDLEHHSDLPVHLQPMVREAAASLAAAEQHVRQFQHVTRVETRDTPVGPSLDLERSV